MSPSRKPLSSLESLHHSSFTPQDPLVEALRAALANDVVLILLSEKEKAFVIHKLISEMAPFVKTAKSLFVVLLADENQANLWTAFLSQNLNINVLNCEDDPLEAVGVWFTTVERFMKTTASSFKEKIEAILIDNAQLHLGNNEFKSYLQSVKQNNPNTRTIAITRSLLEEEKKIEVNGFLRKAFSSLESYYEARIEPTCEILSLLRFVAHPRLCISLYSDKARLEPNELQSRIESLIEPCIAFLQNHNYSLFETYGEEFQDLIEEIPDPTAKPLDLLNDFNLVLNRFGCYCAERAALLLLLKIDKMKKHEKYERHFLLLGVVYSVLMQIRKVCDDTFAQMTDSEKIQKYSSQKLLKLTSILLKFKPEHVGQSSYQVKQEAPLEESNTTNMEAPVEKTDETSNGTKVSKPNPRPRGNRWKTIGSSYDDPNSLYCLILTESSFETKVLFHFIKDLSRSEVRYSFLSPQYVLATNQSCEPNTHSEHNEHKKQEDALRKFRTKECNILISDSAIHLGIDSARCNLVVSFDRPDSFRTFCYQKVKAKAKLSWMIMLTPELDLESATENVKKFYRLERILKRKCLFKEPVLTEVLDADKNDDLIEPFCPKTTSVSLKNAVTYLNRYCSKLPSDTFTRLTPIYEVRRTKDGNFVSKLQLPINSPLRDFITGPPMKGITLAKRSAALETLRILHRIKEIDDNLVAIGKDIHKRDVVSALDNSEPQPLNMKMQGSVKRRQYYYKQVAKGFRASQTHRYHLYALTLRLNCPLPEEQNTRGRKIYPPELAKQSFGMLVSQPLPQLCAFPVYTRSGEVFVTCQLLNDDLILTEELANEVAAFHKYTFTDVLRLEKYPMVFSPEKSEQSTFIVPLVKTENSEDHKMIDWEFLKEIVHNHKSSILQAVSEEERTGFEFDLEKYTDAVVMPWYRNQDHPQYFYVAEICSHLNPKSAFPAEGFETFEKYYKTKYDIQIQNLDQPLLEVDHTSARLNFLTPRYVNRKGVALPSSSEETKKNKRENLDQKQILVPELCAIHPFPASFWRQAVCLPCIFYRLNGLLLAEQLRAQVAREMKLGLEFVPKEHHWEPLTFGWTLADVKKREDTSQPKTKEANQKPSGNSSEEVHENGSAEELKKRSSENEDEDEDDEDKDNVSSSKPKSEMESLTESLVNKMTAEEKKLKEKSLEIGTWTNEMAAKVSDSEKTSRSKEESDDEDDEFMFDPNIALPDNLTLLSSNTLSQAQKSELGGRDWGTGIEQKSFRVGSPTFFSNPNINIPGLMDDLDGMSCTDSSEDEEDFYGFDNRNKGGKNVSNAVSEFEHSSSGTMRIEFKGNDTAEAFEEHDAEQSGVNKLEFLSKIKEEESSMLKNFPWPEEIDGSEEVESEDVPQDSVIVYNADEDFEFSKAVALSNDLESDHDAEALPLLSEYERKLPGINLDQRKTGLIFEPEQFKFSFDHQPDLSTHPGPSPSLILQAITMSNSNDAINLERLETIGDSFLKYAITAYLFSAHPSIHEGCLSHMRSKQVSNYHLYLLGKNKNLGECMIASKFEPHDNWLPPGYYVPKELEVALIESGVPTTHFNMAELPSIDKMNKEEIYEAIQQKATAIKEAYGDELQNSVAIEDMPSFIPYNLLTQHSIPDKSIADCAEALIGAYLVTCGKGGALIFMSWLGLKVLPNDEQGNPIPRLPPPPSPLLPEVSQFDETINFLLEGFESFEDIIGYKFRDRGFLLQAFTHASYFPNRLTDCYQRLEFLGDAVLDYLITRHLYEDSRHHSPGALTDLRSALVNNTIFASLAVKFNFHRYFKHFSPGLQTVINRFVRMQVENGFKISDDHYLLAEEEAEEAEDVEVPKALGDMFESIAGAIFLDSNFSLDTVWQVYYRMMKAEIEQFSTNVPKSPIRELLELEPETAQFGKPEKLADGRRVRVSVEVFGKGVFKGIGRNYRIAKCTAAKCALRALKRMNPKGNRN